MKKKLLFILPLATLCVVGVGASAYQVKAEDEPIIVPIVEEEQEEPEVVEELSAEEVSKLQEILEKVNKEYTNLKKSYDKAMQTKFLGTTLGAMLGGIIVILMELVSRKINNKSLEDALGLVVRTDEVQKKSQELHELANRKIEELEKRCSQALAENTELRKELNFAIQTVKDVTETNKALTKELNDMKAILLKMAYSNKDLVKSGVASDLHENYDKE